MVRPRFVKLPSEQQQVILDAALAEFAAHGFHGASLNRMIKAASISKGSMYYYFDGKEDLYAHVARTQIERLFARLGPLPVPSDREVDLFWATLTDYYLRVTTALTADHRLAALLRGWVAASGETALQQAQQELEQAALPWFEQALAAGQRVGAVRDDVPSALLITVVLGMGQAMDSWLVTHAPAVDDLPHLVDTLVTMIRGAVQPPPLR